MTFVPCPECRGKGTVLEGRLYPNGHTEVDVECEFCEGEGQFEEGDYLMLVLEGKV